MCLRERSRRLVKMGPFFALISEEDPRPSTFKRPSRVARVLFHFGVQRREQAARANLKWPRRRIGGNRVGRRRSRISCVWPQSGHRSLGFCDHVVRRLLNVLVMPIGVLRCVEGHVKSNAAIRRLPMSSLAFSFSNPFRRFASETSRPPYLAFKL